MRCSALAFLVAPPLASATSLNLVMASAHSARRIRLSGQARNAVEPWDLATSRRPVLEWQRTALWTTSPLPGRPADSPMDRAMLLKHARAWQPRVLPTRLPPLERTADSQLDLATLPKLVM